MVTLDQLELNVKHRFYDLCIENRFQYPILMSRFYAELRKTNNTAKDYVKSYNLVKDWALNEYYG